MSPLGKLFGRSGEGKQPRSAREAFPLAQDALTSWSAVDAPSAQLCCVYSSVMDADRELGKDGRSRAWHFDFHLEKSQSFYLVRVVDGKAKGRERRASKNPVEYIYALYGSTDKARKFAEPVMVPHDWVDTTAVAETAYAAFERELADLDPGILYDYGLVCICLAASYVRYLHPEWEPTLLHKPVPSELCYAALIAHADIDQHDSLMVYVNAATGEEAGAERFRFPEFGFMGTSADW